MRTTILSVSIACAIALASVAGIPRDAVASDARSTAQAIAERGDFLADVRGNGNGNNGNGNGNGNGNNGNGRGRASPGHGGTPPGQVGRDSGSDVGGRLSPMPHRGGLGLRPGRTDLCGDENPLFGPIGQSGRSHVAHLAFHEIDPATGDEVEDGAWARMTYFWIGSEFAYVLNAHGVPAGTEHTLIHQAEDGSAICLGDGMANNGGQLHILDRVDPEAHLPPELDPFERATRDDAGLLHLVPTDAVDCEAGTVEAELESALESEHAIRFVDTDVLECPEDAPEEG